jgi:hypothetical protein
MKLSVFACLGLAACGGTLAPENIPELQAADPPSAGANTTVVLEGLNLCGLQANCAGTDIEVKVLTPETLVIDYEAYSATSITFVVPSFVPEGATDIIVVVDGESSNELPFTVLPG